ncbi:MAG: hypothetical protein CSA09_01350 [Candidatus Contendobacter odensis]|uniref:YcgL domain-containing protein CSA09_01350 n=1 Tax=Candidatus Contendibacter odensensis TaxID=1400860 RepID=A0A2G6PG37_9GAMM|nr:MAG: hypothetical protein CSA09_01350 [Candidatus Contendobacter odensis]
MQCTVYKSTKKQDAYIYIAIKDDFSCVPESLLKLFGEPVHVMDLDLQPERKLAQEKTAEVLQNLGEQGWHLQMPRENNWGMIKH